MQPLEGVRVLELATGVAGPYAGKLLADFGAELVKVEPPAGDRARAEGPFPDDVADGEGSSLFLHLNTNKRSVVADATSMADRQLVARLAAWADLVLEGPEPETLAAFGVTPRPGLVQVSVTPFGRSGPYAGWRGADIVSYAMGGPMNATGMADREPLKLAGNVVSVQCGNVAAVAALAALDLAASEGRSVVVDVSNFETQAGSIDRRGGLLMWRIFTGRDATRQGGHRAGLIPAGVYPTIDGYVQVLMAPNWLPKLAELLGDEELRDRLARPDWPDDAELPELLDTALHVWTLSRTKAEAMADAQAAGLGVTALHSPADVLADVHLAAREYWQHIEHPAAGPLVLPGPPARFDDAWQLRRPAPLLDEHGPALRAVELSARPAPPTPSPPPASAARLPLEGVRVLDLTLVWAGPYGTMLLGDLGAEVIRVDNPNRFPTATRGAVPRPRPGKSREIGELWGAFPNDEPGARPWNRVGPFVVHARSKLGATLDTRTELGRETFLRLVEQADVLVENNSAKVLDRLGLGWEELRARNPRLILVRMPSLGLSGPYASFVGFGAHVEALCGLTHLRGYADLDQTANAGTYHMDPASGTTAAFLVLAALRRRELTGEGGLVELAQAENLLHHVGEYLVDAGRGGPERTHDGNRHPTFAPQGCYRCVGDDHWAVLTVPDEATWLALCRVMDAPDLAADERFATAAGRRAHHDELDARIAAWTGTLDRWEVARRCQAEGVPAGPVLDESDLLVDPHLAARGFFRRNGSEDLGDWEFPGHLWRWDGPDLRWGPISRLGADNAYVFRDVLGLDDAEWDALDREGHLRLDFVDADGNPL